MPRISLDDTGRKEYEEMIRRIEILKEVASYYYLTGADQTERNNIATKIYRAVKGFYGGVATLSSGSSAGTVGGHAAGMTAYNDCGSKCWDAKSQECVDCNITEQAMSSSEIVPEKTVSGTVGGASITIAE
jgi:hypothetical protein